MKILIVDDEPHVISVLKIFLKKDNHQILTANNGKQALETIADQCPDFIVTDIQMPEMNGQMLCEEINKNGTCNLKKIIVMTSRTDEELRLWANQFDNILFMEKPLSPRKLVNTLRNIENADQVIQKAI